MRHFVKWTSRERRQRMEITAKQLTDIMPLAHKKAATYVPIINKW